MPLTSRLDTHTHRRPRGPHDLVGPRAVAHRAPRLIERTLRASTAEGMAAEIVTAFAGGGTLIGWAMRLGASPFLVALLGALPLLAQIVHLPSSWLTPRAGRRRVALVALTASRQLLLALALLPFLPCGAPLRQLLLVAVVTLSSALGVVGNNAWVSWMGDLVPERIRGRYFATRTSICTLGGAVGALTSGLLLDLAKRHGAELPALAVFSLVAWVAGLASTILLRRHHDPHPPARTRPPLRALVKPMSDRKARPMLAYQLLWNGAVGLAASFFGLFMLKDLRLGFTLLATHGAVVATIRALATPAWGRALDRVGVRPVLVACSFGIALVPLFWLLPHRSAFVLPISLDAVLSGALGAGHGLASFHLPLASAPSEERGAYVGAFAAVGGVAFAVAALVGSAALPLLPKVVTVFGARLGQLQQLFVLSAAGRVAASGVSLRIADDGAAPVPELWRGLSWWPAWLRFPAIRTAPSAS